MEYQGPKQISDVNPNEVGQPQVQVNIVPTEYLRSHSVLANCPSCGKVAPTAATAKCSCSNYLCYCCFSGCWVIYQGFRRKDINCCDATHSCSQCGSQLGTYNAC